MLQKLKTLNTSLNGYHTYIVCALTVVYALIGGYLKFMPWSEVGNDILVALGAAGFRNAL